MWCVPKVDAEYVPRMEDVLDLYASVPDRKRPVVSFDESPVQLIGEVREPIAASPGRSARIDYEYRRNGTANLFVFLDVHRPWRHVKITDHRADGDASWLNMVEIEIGVLKGQCLSRPIGDRATLESEIKHWQRARNEGGARITWLFTVERARRKMARTYPCPLGVRVNGLAA